MAVVLVMLSCCCWRRCWLFYRHSSREEDRRGWGLMTAIFSLRRAPRAAPAAGAEGEE